MAVDVVVLWVNVADEDWRHRRAAARGQEPSDYVGATNEWDMLRYLLRGIDRHCPWVRRIHLVTPGQTPEWLDPDGGVVVVDQDSLLPPGHPQSFNSMAIEANLDRIPGLAEQFLYFNDDMLVVKPTRREHVFPRGRPAGFAIQNAGTGSGAWSHWLLNAVGIINQAFDKRTVMRRRPGQWFSPRYGRHLLRNIALMPWDSFTGFFEPHLPMALERRTFGEVRAAAPTEMARTTSAVFRSLDCVIPFVYRYWQLCTGRFTPVSPDRYGRFFEIRADAIDEIERELARPRGHFLCLNDVGEHNADLRERVVRALEAALPGASRFERTTDEGSSISALP
jgi:hypothetical protein